MRDGLRGVKNHSDIPVISRQLILYCYIISLIISFSIKRIDAFLYLKSLFFLKEDTCICNFYINILTEF